MKIRPAILAFAFTSLMLGWLVFLAQGVGAIWSTLGGYPWWGVSSLMMVALGTIAAVIGISLKYPRSTFLGLIGLFAGGFALGVAAGVHL